MNNNFGTALLKIAALAGGAFLGTLVAHWFDELLSNRTYQHSDVDKTRYEQGLSPLSYPQQPIIIVNDQFMDEPMEEEQRY